MADVKATDQRQFRQLAEAHQARLSQLESDHQRRWQELEAAWTKCLQPLCEQLRAINDATTRLCPDWESAEGKTWTPPARFQNAARFGRLEGSVEKFVGTLPKDPRLQWFGPTTLSVPLSLVCPGQGSILFESGKSSGEEAFSAINNIIFRLLATTPPGKLSFTIFDPVGLGQNFAALTHLADYEESSLDSRIWTQSAQFEEKLAGLNEQCDHCRIQSGGWQRGGEIPFSGDRLLPGEFHGYRGPAAAQHRRQRRALRGLHAHSLGPAQRGAAGFCAR
jgi:hypothetical protein